MTDSHPEPLKVAKSSQAEIRMREQEGIRLRRKGMAYEEIAERVDGWGSATAARDAILRAIRRETNRDATEIVDERLSQIHGMMEVFYPFAVNDILTVLQYIGKGKDKEPLTCDGHDEDEPHLHTYDTGRHVCYVIPSGAMVEAAMKMLLFQKRESDYIGLDFVHGLAQRQQDLDKAYGQEVLALFKSVFSHPSLNLTTEQKEAAKVVVMEQYKAAKGAA